MQNLNVSNFPYFIEAIYSLSCSRLNWHVMKLWPRLTGAFV